MGNSLSSSRNSSPSDSPFTRPRRGKRSRRKRDQQRTPNDRSAHRQTAPPNDRIDFDPRNLPQRGAPRIHPDNLHRARRTPNGYTSQALAASAQPVAQSSRNPRAPAHQTYNARPGAEPSRRAPHVAPSPLQMPYHADSRPAPPNPAPVRYGRPDTLGLYRKDFINVHRKDYTGRIELLQGSVEGLSKDDETDLLIVYLRERGQYKANRDSSLAALNRSGISLASLERESKIEPSYRRHYHCWLSRTLPRPRPAGFEYKRLLVYEDPGEELTRDDSIILDIVKCLTTVIGGDVQIQSVLIPLSGALLSPSLRKHFVKAAVEVAYAWMHMGLPLRTVKILLPDTDITKDIEMFRKTKDALTQTSAVPPLMPPRNYDVFFSFAPADKESANEMIAYLSSKNPLIRIHVAESRDISVRKRGVVDNNIMDAVRSSHTFLALLSDDYFHSVECTEAFSFAFCRDFESLGNFVVPIYWRTCDLTPLARRLVATEGVDCREHNFQSATVLLDEILLAVGVSKPEERDHAAHADDLFEGAGAGSGMRNDPECRLRIAENLLMKREGNENRELFEPLAEQPEGEETVSQMFFDYRWRGSWAIDFKGIVFGPRIGAGGFGEVYKCRYNQRMVAVKTLQKLEEDDPQALKAEFMVEMKLMSKLRHPNIVEFIGACIHSPNLAIILEFMPGGSLYRAIHRRRRNQLGPFPLIKTVWIAFGIAKGMAHLHSQYPIVIHRDVKSPNVLLGKNVREVKITDFGLSRLRTGSYVNTGPGGTPEWMAPELLRQDAFNEKSDVFSFGVILWELVMCEKPWRDDHPMQIVFKVGSRGEKLPTPPPEQCAPELREMIVECFADDPRRRPTFDNLVQRLNVLCHRVDS
ncbi:Serine/threonine-protein kinase EDR1 [Gracilariopsis chorda]|uniref:Serine/threonine-protein kinase EDR1 n=1 Tax=Gracilariopsis chorda TaxID=448386 RepID=A0A2V3IGC9_9FLOR|nr:Serine/threonine-protein kinase EDR1 [Gracilariopsis chorda]|eukprot:PXF41155.1 Serine/threonine-protein kinase EDR1 [Gracilariopsis chorda]